MKPRLLWRMRHTPRCPGARMLETSHLLACPCGKVNAREYPLLGQVLLEKPTTITTDFLAMLTDPTPAVEASFPQLCALLQARKVKP